MELVPEYLALKASATRFSTSGFIHESVSPKPLSLPLGPFRIFQNSPVANLLPVSATNFSTGTPAVLVANLPPVSLTPVAHLDLRKSPRIFEKFEMTLMICSGAWGKLIYDKHL
jgi:hypothetical protein